MGGLTPLDFVAFGVFVAVWGGYYLLQERTAISARSLNRQMDEYRFLWMRRMLQREVRIVDTQIMASLQNGSAFFASTSLLAIGGALALLKSGDQVAQIFADIPLSQPMAREAWEIKSLGLVLLFVYAFYKFAWAYRIFNYAAIMLGATPLDDVDSKEALAHADRTARLAKVAGRHFNRGQRAFFFALAYLGWFLHPVALILATLGVLAVLMNRQYGKEARFIWGP